MLAAILDDLAPVILVVAAAVGVWLYNVLTRSRPGRRGRRVSSSSDRRSP